MEHKASKLKSYDDELVIPSDFANLSKVEKFITTICKKAKLNDDQCDNLAIAITELVNNAIIHANNQNPSKTVTIRVKYQPEKVMISVIDQGEGFEPDKIANPTDPQNLWKQNGRGIFLVRNLIDQVEITPSPSGTEVLLIEHIS